MLLQKESARNEKHLQPLRENARKLAFLNEASKANDGNLNHVLTHRKYFHYRKQQSSLLINYVR